LPESRAKWMKLIGNSVSVPVIDKLCKAIIETGVFENRQTINSLDGINDEKSVVCLCA
jgi:DNA (cytosine-5)-methyltransferase 1